MTDLTILVACVEVSDQPAREETYVVGVFNNPTGIDVARTFVETLHSGRRVWFKEVPARINVVLPLK